MPATAAVMDAFKNLIRHGKHARAPVAQPPPPVVSVEPSATISGKQHQRRVREQQQHQQQRQAEEHAKQVELKQAPQHATVSHPATILSPHKEIAEFIVKEEREAKNKLPAYSGLENFELAEKMGDGAFSNVYKAFDLRTGKKVAVKIVRKYDLNASQAGHRHLSENFKKRPRVTERANILKEVSIMRGLNHPSIVKLLSFFETEEHFFLVLELMEGGELFHQMYVGPDLLPFGKYKAPAGAADKPLSRHVILQVAHGIRYLHKERGVVHRDIKPENLLFERIPTIPSQNPASSQYDEEKVEEGEFIPGRGGGEIGKVKIADFGLSKVVWAEETATPCGTVGYTAPEIVKDERYSKSVDMWALGCVLYTLLCGFPPFYDESITVLTEKVAKGQYTFLEPWWNNISESAKDLITHLLCVNPAERYTIDEFLSHPWCNETAAPPPPATPAAELQRLRAQYDISLDSPLLQSVRGYGGRSEGRRSPGIAALKEAFDVTYAVHRMGEEGAHRRAYYGPGGAGARGFLGGLNEVNEEEEDAAEWAVVDDAAARRRQAIDIPQPAGSVVGTAAKQPIGTHVQQGHPAEHPAAAGGASAKAHHGHAGHTQGSGGFALDLGNATLIGRRHRKDGAQPSPLGQVTPAFFDTPGSPMRGVDPS